MSNPSEINIDFRLIELEQELRLISELRETLEHQIAHSIAQETLRTESALRKEHDWTEHEIAYQVLDHTLENLHSRLSRGLFLLALWAVFESVISEVAYFIADQRKANLKVQDLYGRSLRDKWSKYFSFVLGYELNFTKQEWMRLNELAALRNFFAHANGRVDQLNDKTKLKIKKIKICGGVEMKLDYIFLNKEFLKDSTEFVHGIMQRLLERVKHDF